ncbi:MAG TPA: BlaI/MecI/CopY family transcriptional regulator [Chthoniobacterales bacterium]
MKPLPRISESEWSIMEVVWSEAPVAAAEIIEALGKSMNWKHQTIRTLLARLVKKKALAFEPDGNRYLYRPLVKRADLVQAESDSFLRRVFAGAAQPLLVHFARKAKLSDEEIRELQEILARGSGK